MANAKETIKQIRELDTIGSIESLIENETRKSVLDYANNKIARLSKEVEVEAEVKEDSDYFDDAQEKDETPTHHPLGSSLGHIHDKK
jgi:hypothetical protein